MVEGVARETLLSDRQGAEDDDFIVVAAVRMQFNALILVVQCSSDLPHFFQKLL